MSLLYFNYWVYNISIPWSNDIDQSNWLYIDTPYVIQPEKIEQNINTMSEW